MIVLFFKYIYSYTKYKDYGQKDEFIFKTIQHKCLVQFKGASSPGP